MSDLRKAAQAAVDLWCLGALGDVDMEYLRAALAQPDESFCDTHCTWHDHYPDCALAQPKPEPEPVAWRYDEATYRPGDLRGRQWRFNLFAVCKPYLHPIQEDMVQNVTPLYAHPPQRKPLTDEQIAKIDWKDGETLHDFARAIEKAHGVGGEHE